jgi:hypothetical protein
MPRSRRRNRGVSRGVDGSAECCLRRSIDLLGWSIPPLPHRFRRTDVVFPSTPAPVFLRIRVHPLVSFISPSERLPLVPARLSCDAELLPWGSCSSSRHRFVESTSDRHPGPVYVPPSTFLTSSTAYSSTRLVGLFHPTTTSRIHASGAFPAARPIRLVGVPCPPAVTSPTPAFDCSLAPGLVTPSSGR